VTRVVLTHAAPRVHRLAQRLGEAGHDVIALPLRRLRPLDGAEPWCHAGGGLAHWDWVVFVSPGALEIALDALDVAWPPSLGIAVIGPGSAEALAAHERAPVQAPVACPATPPYDAAGLMREPPFASPAGLRVLVVRGERGRDDWIDALRARGAAVEVRALYRMEPQPPDAGGLARLRAWAADGAAADFVFAGVETVIAVDALLGEQGLRDWAHGQRALAVHPRIAESLRARGWRRTQALEPGERGLLHGIESP